MSRSQTALSSHLIKYWNVSADHTQSASCRGLSVQCMSFWSVPVRELMFFPLTIKGAGASHAGILTTVSKILRHHYHSPFMNLAKKLILMLFHIYAFVCILLLSYNSQFVWVIVVIVCFVDSTGTLHVGDEIREINGISVANQTVEQLQKMLVSAWNLSHVLYAIVCHTLTKFSITALQLPLFLLFLMATRCLQCKIFFVQLLQDSASSFLFFSSVFFAHSAQEW